MRGVAHRRQSRRDRVDQTDGLFDPDTKLIRWDELHIIALVLSNARQIRDDSSEVSGQVQPTEAKFRDLLTG
jgi:hypothetical protein